MMNIEMFGSTVPPVQVGGGGSAGKRLQDVLEEMNREKILQEDQLWLQIFNSFINETV
jgi:hypothetical protein